MPDLNITTSTMMFETIPATPQLIPTKRLNKELKQQALSFSIDRQRQFLMGRALLAELVYQQHGVEILPEIRYQNNKPIFTQQKYGHFNISHSDNYIVVILSSQPIGLDIEKVRKRTHYQKIAQYCFSEMDNHWLSQQPDMLRAFFQLWTQREAILKLYGKGVWQMKQLSIDLADPSLHSSSQNSLYCTSGYVAECVFSIAQRHTHATPQIIDSAWRTIKNNCVIQSITQLNDVSLSENLD